MGTRRAETIERSTLIANTTCASLELQHGNPPHCFLLQTLADQKKSQETRSPELKFAAVVNLALEPHSFSNLHCTTLVRFAFGYARFHEL
jgi:hypothetical protein